MTVSALAFYVFASVTVAAGLILLVAMIGAIVLTLYHRPDIKRQNILDQIYRDRADSVELRDVEPGQGV